jgi:hypothetical protein
MANATHQRKCDKSAEAAEAVGSGEVYRVRFRAGPSVHCGVIIVIPYMSVA